MLQSGFRDGARRLVSALAFGGVIAAIAVLLGSRDLESYEHVFFSLDRGTAVEGVSVLGQPVYTLDVGLGVRLPLQGSIGASPGARLAPLLPAPLTYWLLLTFSIAAAVVVVRHALAPLCGRLMSWLAPVLLFCSVPMVDYTVSVDWVATALTYGTFVACVFAPHALLALLAAAPSPAAWCLAGVSVAGTVWGLVAVSHAGHWPILAGALLLASALALCRFEHSLRTRVSVVAVIGIAALVPVALQVPDILRELEAASTSGPGELKRIVEGAGVGFLSANAFPFRPSGSRLPFTHLLLAVVSLLIGLTTSDPRLRRLTIGSAFISLVLGIGAARMRPGASVYAPTVTWALRDPAIAFAVFSAACAASALRVSPWAGRPAGGLAVAALVLAGIQGPAFAASLAATTVRQDGNRWRWNQDLSPLEERLARRGFALDGVATGGRLALWPEARDEMRDRRSASTDFADAGYTLVTAWTKQRTMRGLVANDWLFNQTTDLPSDILCDAEAVQFLQLHYLLLPPGVECAPWARVPGLLVDDWLEVGVAQSDGQVRTLPVASLEQPLAREPALSAGSQLLRALTPLPGTSLILDGRGVVIRLKDPAIAAGRALILPVAYDPAWRASSGQPRNAGGLLALVAVDEAQVTAQFVPDAVAVLRGLSMTLAQILAVAGLVGLAYLQPARQVLCQSRDTRAVGRLESV